MPPALSPAERSLRASAAAHALAADGRGRERAARATEAFLETFRTQIDPEGVLPAEEREKRAKSLLRSHMSRLALQRSRRMREGREAEELARLSELAGLGRDDGAD